MQHSLRKSYHASTEMMTVRRRQGIGFEAEPVDVRISRRCRYSCNGLSTVYEMEAA